CAPVGQKASGEILSSAPVGGIDAAFSRHQKRLDPGRRHSRESGNPPAGDGLCMGFPLSRE
ncbi:MAG: hypothetical protein ACRD3T_01665, partial [Terriglobia bacterium]